MCKPFVASFLSVFPLVMLLPLLILVERVATVADWAVTEAASCFIIARISVRSFLVPLTPHSPHNP